MSADNPESTLHDDASVPLLRRFRDRAMRRRLIVEIVAAIIVTGVAIAYPVIAAVLALFCISRSWYAAGRHA